ncbi:MULTISPECIES: hypothetical protein [Actinocorallia]|uniref:Phage gp6-like head-tail connector protein n=2 Tax=Actinocorallia TaxID=58108 RepID=A0ABP6H8E5_9ACTN
MPPEAVYADIGDLKAEYSITDIDRDELLTEALEAASRYVDRACGRRFWLDGIAAARRFSPLRNVVSDGDGTHLLINDIGSLDGLVVEIGTGSSWTDVTDSVETEPLNALDDEQPITSLLRGAWPCGGGQRVRVTARWGWPAVPAPVRVATLRQASRLFKRKDSPDGITGSAEWGIVRVSRVDPDVAALLRPYVLPGLG